MATTDESVETGLFRVRTSYLDGGGNLFWIHNRKAAEECLAVLYEGKPMLFSLLHEQDCFAKIPLENDVSYRAKFAELKDRIAVLEP